MPDLDFNQLFDAFAEAIADKVVARLKTTDDWPNIDESIKVPLVDFPDNSDVAGKVDPVNVVQPWDTRKEKLTKEDIRTLRKKVALVEGKLPSEYSEYKKDALVDYILKLETIIGRTLDEEINKFPHLAIEDDTDFSSTSTEPEDDTDNGVLTREQAQELDLADLKSYALTQGIPSDQLVGLDVIEVLNKIFGAPTNIKPSDNDDSEETEYLTEEEITSLSISELKKLADELDIKYTRSTLRGELIKSILESLEEEE